MDNLTLSDLNDSILCNTNTDMYKFYYTKLASTTRILLTHDIIAQGQLIICKLDHRMLLGRLPAKKGRYSFTDAWVNGSRGE